MGRKAQTLRDWSGGRTAIPDVPTQPRPVSAKKDTKRWCLGKVGREHRKEWRRNSRFDWGPRRPDHEAWWTETCAACSKEFRSCWNQIFIPRRPCVCGHHASPKGPNHVE